MKEVAKLRQLPPVYMGKWATATDEEAQEELEKGTPYTYRFRVPQEGSLKINDLIRGEVSSPPIFRYLAYIVYRLQTACSLASLVLNPSRFENNQQKKNESELIDIFLETTKRKRKMEHIEVVSFLPWGSFV